MSKKYFKIKAMSLTLALMSATVACNPPGSPLVPNGNGANTPASAQPTTPQSNVSRGFDFGKLIDDIKGAVTGTADTATSAAGDLFAQGQQVLSSEAQSVFDAAIKSGNQVVQEGAAIVQNIGDGSQRLFHDVKNNTKVLVVDGVAYAEGQVKNGKVFIDGALRDTGNLAEGTYHDGKVWVNGAWKDSLEWTGRTADTIANHPITQLALDEILGRNIKDADWVLNNLLKSRLNLYLRNSNFSAIENAANINSYDALWNQFSQDDPIEKFFEQLASDNSNLELVLELNPYAAEVLIAVVREFEPLEDVAGFLSLVGVDTRTGLTDPAFWLNKLLTEVGLKSLDADEQRSVNQEIYLAQKASSSEVETKNKNKKASAKKGKANVLGKMGHVFKALATVLGPELRLKNKGNGLYIVLKKDPNPPFNIGPQPAFSKEILGIDPAQMYGVEVISRPGSLNAPASIPTGRTADVIPPDSMALLNGNNTYLSAKLSDSSRELKFDAGAEGGFERFQIEYLEAGHMAIKAANGLYIGSNEGDWLTHNNLPDTQFKQVVQSASGLTLALGTNNKIYRLVNGNWQPEVICCGFEKIAIGPNDKVWGLAGGKLADIFFGNGGGYNTKPGEGFKDISIGKDGQIWLVNHQDKVYKHFGDRFEVAINCCAAQQVYAVDEINAWVIAGGVLHRAYSSSGGGIINQNNMQVKSVAINQTTGETWALTTSNKLMKYQGNDRWVASQDSLPESIRTLGNGQNTVVATSESNKGYYLNNAQKSLSAKYMALDTNTTFRWSVDPSSQRINLITLDGRYVREENGKLVVSDNSQGHWLTLKGTQQNPTFRSKPVTLQMDDSEQFNPILKGGAKRNWGLLNTAIEIPGQGYGEIVASKATDFQTAINISMFVNMKSRGGDNYQTLVRKATDSANQALVAVYSLNMDSSNRFLNFSLTNGNASNSNGSGIQSSKEMPLNQWVHVAATWSVVDQKMRLYMDGEQVAEGIFNNQIGINKEPVIVGASFRPESIRHNFNGLIDHLSMVGPIPTEERANQVFSRDDILEMATGSRTATKGNWSESTDPSFNHRLKHISVGADGTVLGVSPIDHVYRYTGDNYTREVSCCGVSKLSVTPNGRFFGFDSTHQVFEGYLGNGGGLINKPSLLRDISVGHDGTVWGRGTDDKIYVYDGTQHFNKVTDAFSFKRIVGRPDGKAWAVDFEDTLYEMNRQGEIQSQGIKVLDVASGPDGTHWAISMNQTPMRLENGLWNTKNGKLVQISVGKDSQGNTLVMGVSHDNKIWKFSD